MANMGMANMGMANMGMANMGMKMKQHNLYITLHNT